MQGVFCPPTTARRIEVAEQTCQEERCGGSVGMAVVGVREVRMAMPHQRVRMGVRVRAAPRVPVVVRVRMVVVMEVPMRVHNLVVQVLVLVILGQVQPHADRHECESDQEPERHRFV